MKALHRTVIGGAFGALAVVTVAAGAGFACTPSQQIFINAPVGPAGTAVTVEAFGFEPQTEMEVHWNTPTGAVLGATYVNTVAAAGVGRPQAVVTVTIPDVAPATYVIVATQAADGVVVRRAPATFTVTPPVVADPPVAPAVPPVVPPLVPQPPPHRRSRRARPCRRPSRTPRPA